MSAVAGLLLTGGASRRMGVAKATLLLRGETLAGRGARLLREVCSPVLEVGPAFSPLPAVRERAPGAGPLAALDAGAVALRERGHEGPALVLAVDLPNVGAPLLRLLAEWAGDQSAVPYAAGVPQLTCARYGPDALLAAGSLLAGGVRSLRALLDVVDFDRVDEARWAAVAGADAFADVDTPSDAARLGIDLPG